MAQPKYIRVKKDQEFYSGNIGLVDTFGRLVILSEGYLGDIYTKDEATPEYKEISQEEALIRITKGE